MAADARLPVGQEERAVGKGGKVEPEVERIAQVVGPDRVPPNLLVPCHQGDELRRRHDEDVDERLDPPIRRAGVDAADLGMPLVEPPVGAAHSRDLARRAHRDLVVAEQVGTPERAKPLELFDLRLQRRERPVDLLVGLAAAGEQHDVHSLRQAAFQPGFVAKQFLSRPPHRHRSESMFEHRLLHGPDFMRAESPSVVRLHPTQPAGEGQLQCRRGGDRETAHPELDAQRPGSRGTADRNPSIARARRGRGADFQVNPVGAKLARLDRLSGRRAQKIEVVACAGAGATSGFGHLDRRGRKHRRLDVRQPCDRDANVAERRPARVGHDHLETLRFAPGGRQSHGVRSVLREHFGTKCLQRRMGRHADAGGRGADRPAGEQAGDQHRPDNVTRRPTPGSHARFHMLHHRVHLSVVPRAGAMLRRRFRPGQSSSTGWSSTKFTASSWPIRPPG